MLEQVLEGREGLSFVNLWEQSSAGRGTAIAKVLRQRGIGSARGIAKRWGSGLNSQKGASEMQSAA
jgi:hypothetical protein